MIGTRKAVPSEKAKQPHHTSREPAVSNGSAGRRRRHRHSGATRVRPPAPAETNLAAAEGTATANVPQRTPSNTRMPHNARLASAPMRCNAWQVHPETVHAPDHQLPAPGRRPAGRGADLPIHRRQRQQGVHQPAAGRRAGADRGTAADQYRGHRHAGQGPGRRNARRRRASAAYEILALSDLPTEEALRANNGTFNVSVSIRPALRSGHQLQLVLDGKPYGTPSSGTRFTLHEIDRGDHSLAVQVLNGERVLQASPPVSFTVQRVHLGKKR